MNGDRKPQDFTIPGEADNISLIAKIRQIPLIPRILLYILVMTIIGVGMGEVKYRLTTSDCMQQADCWLVDPARRRMRELGLGAIGGIFAATLMSITALLSQD